MLLGFRIHHSKTEIYRCAPHHKCAPSHGKVLAPVFKYLGHHLVHSNFLGWVHTELLSPVTADLARYQQPPPGCFWASTAAVSGPLP